MTSRTSLALAMAVLVAGQVAHAESTTPITPDVFTPRTDRWFFSAHVGFVGMFDGAWGHITPNAVQSAVGGSFGRDLLEWSSSRVRLGLEIDYTYTSLSGSIAGSTRRVDLHAPRAGVLLRWMATPVFDLHVRTVAGVMFADTTLRSNSSVPALQGLSYAFSSELTAGLAWVPRLTRPRAARAVYLSLMVDGGVMLGTPLTLRVSPSVLNGADMIAGEGTSLGSVQTMGALGRVSLGLRF